MMLRKPPQPEIPRHPNIGRVNKLIENTYYSDTRYWE